MVSHINDILLPMNRLGSLNILLVQPSVEDFYFTPHRSSSLGLHSLAASWKARGHNCTVVNCAMEKPLKKQISLPESLTYLTPYLSKQTKDLKGTSWFNKYYRFGPSAKVCAEKIAELKPDVVAVSCFAWSYSESSRKLLEHLQEIRGAQSSSFILVAGGPGVTVMPEYFTSHADLIVGGEGEDAIISIEKIAEKLAGRTDYPAKGKVISLEFSDELPFVYNIRNRRNSRFTVSTMISRGCPKMCSFCANHLVFGRYLRKVPIEELKKGMDSLVKEIIDSGSQQKDKLKLHINFEDDNILFYKEYFLDILNYINEICTNNKIDFTFTAENGVDYVLLDNALMDKFHSLNIVQLNLSMASLDTKQLRLEKRSGNIKKLESIIKHSTKLNIPSITYFICGLKTDTPVSIVQTINYLHNLNTSIGISLYYPVPGLVDWQDKNLFVNNSSSLCRGSSAYPWNKSLNTQELITAFRLARSSNYIKSSKLDNKQIGELKIKLLNDGSMNKGMVDLFLKTTIP